MASTYLNRTIGSSSTLSTKATISFWVKKSLTDSSTNFYGILSSNGGWDNGSGFAIGWREDLLVWYNLANGTGYRTYTNRKFRDTSAFYHIVYKIDTTQASMQDRVTLYVNGEDQGDLTSNTSIANAMPSQNGNLYYFLDNGDTCQIGRGGNAGSTYFNGSMTHFHFIDGTAYDADTFGEIDSVSGNWKAKTSPSVTYGNNGFFIKGENSSALGTDSSGRGNNFTVNGTPTQTIDTPSNVFATLNPLHFGSDVGTVTMSNGNLTFSNSGSDSWRPSTQAVSSGKYYAEFKTTGVTGAGGVGINSGALTGYTGSGAYDYVYLGNGIVYNNDNNQGGTFASPSTNDIIGVAVDLDNNKIYFSINGTFQNSADPTSGATGTGAIAVADPSSNGTGVYHFSVGDAGSGTVSFQANFGNGFFGTTAVASAQNPDDGIGIFEHDVPTGYRALCTKSINAQEYS